MAPVQHLETWQIPPHLMDLTHGYCVDGRHEQWHNNWATHRWWTVCGTVSFKIWYIVGYWDFTLIILFWFLSYACSIQLEDIVILTGGQTDISTTMNTASVYSTDGWVEDLPDLMTGRYHHGCGHYVNNDNKMVTPVTFTWWLYSCYKWIWINFRSI